ncbi:hypothetical protein GF314_11685 [bacterium]|nr:hypothetical protein [bacterium]
MRPIVIAALAVSLASAALQASASDRPRGPWCGGGDSGPEPRVFAPRLLATAAAELGGTFMPDGREFYFTRRSAFDAGDDRLWWTRLDDDGWSAPRPAPFAADARERQPHVTPDGGRIYFVSERATGQPALWAADREGEAWGPPFRVAAMARNAGIASVSAAADGSLYAGTPGGLVRIELGGAGFEPARPVPLGLGTLVAAARPFVVPDERVLLFDAREHPAAEPDLYVCHRERSGAWSAPRPLPDAINTDAAEFGAWLSPDGAHLFFVRAVGGDADLWWVDATVLDPLICGW